MAILTPLAGPIATVIVAMFAAIWAVRKDAQARNAERYHLYIDQRREDYSVFLRQMNSTVGAFWASTHSKDAKAHERVDAECLELDTLTYLLTLYAPYEVASWARQTNGSIQTACLNRMNGDEYEVGLNALERAKPKLLSAMQDDIRLIETAGSRKRYEKLRLKAKSK